MKSLLLCVLFISALFCVSAQEVEDNVYVLTKDNFDSFVDSEDISLVEFYAPWCGHCKKLTPEYAKAAGVLKSNNPVVKLAKVDATIESELGSRFGVSGYPTIKIFRSGSASEYKGPRDADGIIAFMKKQAAPSITNIKTVADLEKFIADEAGVVFFGDAASKLGKSFSDSAAKLRENFRFATTDAQEVLDKIGHKGEVVLFQSKRYAQSPLESIKAVFEEGASDLSAFINDNILPLVGEIHPDNQAQYHARDKPLLKVYADKLDWKLDSKGANYLLNKVRKVAKEYKDKFTFAVAHRSKHQKEYDDAGLKGDLGFAIHDLKKGHKYPASSTFSADSFKQHIEDYLAEKLQPYIKSEPVPEQKPGEPTVIVGKNFEQIVMDPTKDVLLEAYAPWCGHCKTLEPKYKELAAKMEPYSDSLVIAKVDATANDLPPNFQVRGYPTIFFVPANNKDKPMNYDGQREVNDFVNYIKRNAHIPLKEKTGGAATDDKHDEL